MLSLNPLYETRKDSVGSASVEDSKKMYLDFNFGRQEGGGLYYGLLYISDSVSNLGSTQTLTGYGPSIGYMTGAWFVHGHYVFSAEFDPATGDNQKWTKGSGLQMDLGYLMNISGPLNFGLQLSFRNLQFKSNNTGGVDDESNARSINELYPKFRFTFLF